MSQIPNIDDRLLDWLYGELDEGEAARFEAELDSNPALKAEAEGLLHTREMVGQLEDVEAPVALSSYLLHTAAKEVAKAPAGGPARQGFLASVVAGFRSFAARPALAAMAGLVVVVGLTGVLLSRGGMDAASETPAIVSAADEAPAEKAAVAAPASGTASDDPSEGDAVGEEAWGNDQAKDEALAPPPADSDAEDSQNGLARAEESTSRRVGTVADGRQREAVNRKRAKTRRTKNMPEALRGQKADKKKVASKRPQRVRGPKLQAAPRRDGLALSKSGGKYADTNAVTSADYGAPSAGKGAASSPRGGMLGTARDEPQGYRPYKQDQQLNDKWAQGRLSALGKTKDCKRAAAIANDILERNPSFYYKKVRAAKRVKQCRWYVSNETKRRSRLRGKKSGGDGSATAAPRKSKRRAAPAKAERSYDEVETK